MPNFPTGLDALANPGPTTKRNDPGFELDVVISTLNDIAEALEAKLGIGASTAAANQVLRGTAAGVTGWGTVATAMLAANAATKMWSISTPSVTNSATSALQVTTINTPDWAGNPGLLLWSAYINHSQLSAAWTLSYSLDGGALTGFVTAQAAVANVAFNVCGLIPVLGVSAGNHDHKLWVQTNQGVTWTLGPGNAAIVELRR